MAHDVFHAGEIEVQERAGVRAVAQELGEAAIAPRLDVNFAVFLREQYLLIAGGHGTDGRMWASPLLGQRGFARTAGQDTLVLHSELAPGDPLGEALQAGEVKLGLLALDAMSRSRIRVNGTARQTDEGIELQIAETFGNCPKYIQRRTPVELLNEGERGTQATTGTALDATQRALVHAADTFYIATANAQHGADASHRGGRPGFIEISDDGSRLTWPDYQGNNMFMTLGNLTADPATGLLFVDWETGTTLQLSGRATIDWDDAQRIARWPRAKRLVDFEIEAVVQRANAIPLRWELVEYSKVTPPAPAD
jgi:predicted pyridoxine 5'-phosphate oxidase superfamily flavin-nucleotide-binding protein